MGPTIKGGNVELVDVLTPSEAIPTRGSFQTSLVVKNTASFIIGDKDGCSRSETPCGGKDGYCIRGVAGLDGEQAREAFQCINLPFTGLGSNKERIDVVLSSPSEPGQYNVAGFIEASNSGERSSPLSSQITVSDDTVVNPPPENGDGGGGGGIPDLFRENPAATVALTLGGVVAIDQLLGE